MPNALVALGDGPTRPRMSALDERGRVDKGCHQRVDFRRVSQYV
jgi:hypothetical protein